MQFQHIDPARVERDWPVIAHALWPAVRQDPTYRLEGLRDRLTAERPSAVLFHACDGADGLLIVSVDDDNGRLIAWTTAIVGTIQGRPKERLKAMREAILQIEQVARNAGCTAHRICGRDYSRLFPEYRPFAGARNGLEKVL